MLKGFPFIVSWEYEINLNGLAVKMGHKWNFNFDEQ